MFIAVDSDRFAPYTDVYISIMSSCFEPELAKLKTLHKWSCEQSNAVGADIILSSIML